MNHIPAPNHDILPPLNEGTVAFEDEETRFAIEHQLKIERRTILAIAALLGVYALMGLIKNFSLGYLFWAAVLWFGGVLITFAMVDLVVFKAMRSVRYGKCLKRIRIWLDASATVSKWSGWTTPLPGAIALDLKEKVLYVESPQTGYRCLALRAPQLIDVKVEREQTIETTTSNGMSMMVFPTSWFGLMSGSKSRSKSKVVEQAFLEISYALSPEEAPRRVSLDFGADRRTADDWRAGIVHMLQHS